MMRIEDDTRQPIHGRTITAGFDGMLDIINHQKLKTHDVVKALNKFMFIHPEYRAEISAIVRKLEA